MKSTDNDKDKITLESIDKKLNSIKEKVNGIQKQNKDPKSFISSILLMMSFLLISLALTITFQVFQPYIEFLWFYLVVYLSFGLAFLWMSVKIMEKKYGKL